MAQDSKIEWTTHTANLWWGCQKVHAGCDNCYAETLDNRWGGKHWGPHAPRRIILSVWNDLLKYQAAAAAAGEVHRVFVGSMMDIFEKPMPLSYQDGKPVTTLGGDRAYTCKLRDDLFANISDGLYPNLLFLLLTKRPGNILKYIPEEWKTNPPANVMYGTSPVDQETADEMIPKLLEVPGRHFLSCEPLLGPIDLEFLLSSDQCSNCGRDNWGDLGSCLCGYSLKSAIDWVIVGGESGHGARPMYPGWVRSLRDQCAAAEVPFLFKQWGEWVDEFHPITDRTVHQESDVFVQLTEDKSDYRGVYMYRVGKKGAGRLLDGKEYTEFPESIITKEVSNG